MASPTSTVHVSLEGPQIRDLALGRALQLHSYDSKAAAVVETAKTFEDYLTGPAPARPAPNVAEASSSAVRWNAEDEQWRIDVENLPLDGEVKNLGGTELAYRIEALAALLFADPHETPANRQAALDELRATIGDLSDILADGAE